MEVVFDNSYNQLRIAMRGDIGHITEITRRDMKEIADAANMHPGDGINIQRTAEGLEISIDRGQLARWVKKIIQGGNI